MNIESCILAIALGGLIIILNEPLAKLLHIFYHKVLRIEGDKDKVQRTKLVLIINGTIIMLIYAWNLRNALTAAAPGN